MQYRKFKDGAEVSLFGIGTMRLPKNAEGKIDRPKAIKMIRDAIDKGGVNYVDTAYMYHNGESEIVVGEALKDGYREKVFLADKMPAWFARSEEDIEKIFLEQLDRLKEGYIDYYLLHNVNKSFWKLAEKYNVMKFLERMKAEGKIGHIGFSFHDDLEFFKKIVDAYPWEFCQIQLNFMDKNAQAGVEGLKYAAQKGLSVIIMEPLKGGKLTDKVPENIQAIWDEVDVKRTPAEWALSWLANFEEVTCILSGVSSQEQMEQNVETLSKATPGCLSEGDIALIDRVSDEYNRMIKYSCTGCRYCLPCVKKIDIPDIIELCNDQHAFGDTAAGHMSYAFQPEGKRAGDCIGCRECEAKCPQQLKISEIMKETAQIFGS